MHIFVRQNSLEGIFNENRKALSESQYPLEDVHGLSENSPNMKISLIRITVMVAPLSSKLAWNYDVFQLYLDPPYRSSKYPDTPSSNNQLSI